MLRVTEIFVSIQGESSLAGWPTVFVRLTGCPLRCGYCDTAYAFHGGTQKTIDDICAEVAEHGVTHVCVTGGEPLAQAECLALMTQLCDAGHVVSLETSGALDISAVDPRVKRVVDLKTPSSGESGRNQLDNIKELRVTDEVKFVVGSRDDFDWACEQVAEHRIHERCPVLMSPVHDALPPADLAQWVVSAELPLRLQMQMHKMIWGNEPGR